MIRIAIDERLAGMRFMVSTIDDSTRAASVRSLDLHGVDTW